MIGIMLAVIAVVSPNVIKPVFVALTLVTAPIGIIVGEVMIFLVYYTVLSPIGIFFRFVQRDPLQRKFEHQAKTYWQPKDSATDAASYYRQS